MVLQLRRLGHVQRKEQLEEHYGLSKNKEIALACGVHLSTINKDIAAWKASGEYDEWLDRRWHYYLESEEIPDLEKFRALTRLKEKRQARLSLTKVEHSGKIGLDINDLLKTYEELFKEDAIPKDDTRKPVHTSHTNSEASEVPTP